MESNVWSWTKKYLSFWKSEKYDVESNVRRVEKRVLTCQDKTLKVMKDIYLRVNCFLPLRSAYSDHTEWRILSSLGWCSQIRIISSGKKIGKNYLTSSSRYIFNFRIRPWLYIVSTWRNNKRISGRTRITHIIGDDEINSLKKNTVAILSASHVALRTNKISTTGSSPSTNEQFCIFFHLSFPSSTRKSYYYIPIENNFPTIISFSVK